MRTEVGTDVHSTAKALHGTPIFLDQLLVLGHFRNTGEGSPIGRLLVIKADVDVSVVVDLVKLATRVICNEHERQVGFGVSLVKRSLSQLHVCTSRKSAESKAYVLQVSLRASGRNRLGFGSLACLY